MSAMFFDLSGRVAVVTGGTTGLGHAIALGLAEAGADVVASSRRLEQVEKVAAEIEALGRRSLACDQRRAEPGIAAGAARCRTQGVRQGGYPCERCRDYPQSADARSGRGTTGRG